MESGSEYKKIGRRIRHLRAGRGISQGSLARQMELSQTNLSNIENGKTKVTLKNLFKIREFLGCSMKDFFEDSLEETYDITDVMEAVRILKKMRLEEEESE